MPFDPKQHMRILTRKQKGKDKQGREEWKTIESDYLDVKWRLVWLREQYPDAIITTTLLAHDDSFALFRSTISVPSGASATGHGSETKADFGDYIEKAETKAVGRALAMLGFGTQFAPDLDEGHRIVDTPVERRPPANEPPHDAASPTQQDWYLSTMHKLGYDSAKAQDMAEDIGRRPFTHVQAVALREVVEAVKAERVTYGPDPTLGHIGWRITEAEPKRS